MRRPTRAMNLPKRAGIARALRCRTGRGTLHTRVVGFAGYRHNRYADPIVSLAPGAIVAVAVFLSAGPPQRASDLVLELAKVPSPYDHESLSLVFRAVGKRDIYFNRAAVR